MGLSSVTRLEVGGNLLLMLLEDLFTATVYLIMARLWQTRTMDSASLIDLIGVLEQDGEYDDDDDDDEEEDEDDDRDRSGDAQQDETNLDQDDEDMDVDEDEDEDEDEEVFEIQKAEVDGQPKQLYRVLDTSQSAPNGMDGFVGSAHVYTGIGGNAPPSGPVPNVPVPNASVAGQADEDEDEDDAADDFKF